jgi:serine/threonine protein kinase
MLVSAGVSDTEDDTMPGHLVLGKYRLVGLLNEGGLCEIYLARDTTQPRDVAVKLLRESMLNHTTAREHFRREIHIMSRFEHPNAVTFYDADPKAVPSPILVMEYLRGYDLATVLHHARILTPERAGNILAQLCSVLEAAHQAGIVHRDIKPANLMILNAGTPDEVVKLMDFGLAKKAAMLYLGADEMFDWTLPAAAGTPEYVCPEQIRSCEVDRRGDIYSVGVILYEMLTGRRPFESSSVEELLFHHTDTNPPSFRSLGQGNRISPSLEMVVHRCLAKHPDDRFQSATELVQAYEQALGRTFLPRKTPSSNQQGGQLNGVGGGHRPGNPPGISRATAEPMVRAADRHAIRQRIDAKIPESMALLKIKGFIQDIGADLIESSPGFIRVRVREAAPKQAGWSLFSKKAAPPTICDTDMELRMERPDPTQVNHLAITLVMRPLDLLITAEWRARCNQIGRDLKAYLIGQ